MAEFKVGDRVQCVAMDHVWYVVPDTKGTVEKIESDLIAIRTDEPGRYLKLGTDDVHLWWYNLSNIIPLPTPRITPIEWHAPDECLPNDGAHVIFTICGRFEGGTFRDGVFDCDHGDWLASEIDLWAYAPEVKK